MYSISPSSLSLKVMDSKDIVTEVAYRVHVSVLKNLAAASKMYSSVLTSLFSSDVFWKTRFLYSLTAANLDLEIHSLDVTGVNWKLASSELDRAIPHLSLGLMTTTIDGQFRLLTSTERVRAYLLEKFALNSLANLSFFESIFGSINWQRDIGTIVSSIADYGTVEVVKKAVAEGLVLYEDSKIALLRRAAHRDYLEMYEYLLDRPVKWTDFVTATYIHEVVAACTGLRVLKYITPKLLVEWKIDDIIIWLAGSSGDKLSLVQYLLSYGQEIGDLGSAMDVAVSTDNLKILQELLKYQEVNQSVEESWFRDAYGNVLKYLIAKLFPGDRIPKDGSITVGAVHSKFKKAITNDESSVVEALLYLTTPTIADLKLAASMQSFSLILKRVDPNQDLLGVLTATNKYLNKKNTALALTALPLKKYVAKLNEEPSITEAYSNDTRSKILLSDPRVVITPSLARIALYAVRLTSSNRIQAYEDATDASPLQVYEELETADDNTIQSLYRTLLRGIIIQGLKAKQLLDWINKLYRKECTLAAASIIQGTKIREELLPLKSLFLSLLYPETSLEELLPEDEELSNIAAGLIAAERTE